MKKPLKICCLVVATAGAQGCDNWEGDMSVPEPTGGSVTGGVRSVPGTGGDMCEPQNGSYPCGTGGIPVIGSGGTVGGFIGDWGGGGSSPDTGGMPGGPVAVSWCKAEDGSSRWIYDEDAGIAPGAPCSPVVPWDEDGGVGWDEDGGVGWDEDGGF